MRVAVSFCSAIFVLGFCSGARAVAEDVLVRPKLKEGDTFRLEVRHLRENSTRPHLNGTATTTVDVRVLAAGPDGFTLVWTPGAAAFDNARVAQDPVFTAAAKALTGLELRVTLNGAGAYAGLANQDEVTSRLQAVVREMMRSLTAQIPPAQSKQLQAMAEQLLSPAALVASATRDVQTYFGLNGSALSVGVPVEAALERPNPLGGAPIPTTFRVTAESATADTAAITSQTTFDAAALVRATQALVEKQGRRIPAEESNKLPPMEMADDGRYVFDRTIGLMREIVVTRRVKVGESRRFDSWTIRLVSGPSR